MKPPVLRVTDLTIQRGEFRILDHFSWIVERGEHWVLFGPNGSGKTSLLSVLTGYLNPTSGRIEVLGDIYGECDWREMRKSIGLVSSSIRQMVPDGETALETVVSGKYAMIDYWGDVTADDAKEAKKLLIGVEAESLMDREWMYLSQGERQRVLIARALMATPKLLILDEPCAGLDPVAREQFLRFVGRMASRKNSPSIVFVTHHVEEITPIFTHALMIALGQCIASGAIQQTLNSKNLSAAFGHHLRLRRRTGKFRLEFGDAASF